MTERPDKEGRVRVIMHLMAQDQWVRGRTYKRLADQWGMSRMSLRKDSAEASRRMSALHDPELAAEMAEGLLVEAAEAAREAEGAEKARELTRVAEAVARIAGIDRGRGPKVQVVQGAPGTGTPWMVVEGQGEERKDEEEHGK